VKKSLKASRSGGDVVEVLQRRLMTSSRRNVKNLIVWPDYDVLLPFFSQMIRNCKTLKISLPDLLLIFFTPSEGLLLVSLKSYCPLAIRMTLKSFFLTNPCNLVRKLAIPQVIRNGGQVELHTASYITSTRVIPAKAGIQPPAHEGLCPGGKNTGSPRIKYGAGLVKPGMTKGIRLMPP